MSRKSSLLRITGLDGEVRWSERHLSGAAPGVIMDGFLEVKPESLVAMRWKESWFQLSEDRISAWAVPKNGRIEDSVLRREFSFDTWRGSVDYGDLPEDVLGVLSPSAESDDNSSSDERSKGWRISSSSRSLLTKRATISTLSALQGSARPTLVIRLVRRDAPSSTNPEHVQEVVVSAVQLGFDCQRELRLLAEWYNALREVFTADVITDHESSEFRERRGELWKKGHRRTNWQKRLFVLAPTCLSYYKGSELKGSISLSDPANFEMIKVSHSGRSDNRRYCLSLSEFRGAGAAKTKVDYLIDCETKAERKGWMNDIEKALAATVRRRTQNAARAHVLAEGRLSEGEMEGSDSRILLKRFTSRTMSIGSNAIGVKFLGLYSTRELPQSRVELCFISRSKRKKSKRVSVLPLVPAGFSQPSWPQQSWSVVQGNSLALRLTWTVDWRDSGESRESRDINERIITIHLPIGPILPQWIEVIKEVLYLQLTVETAAELTMSFSRQSYLGEDMATRGNKTTAPRLASSKRARNLSGKTTAGGGLAHSSEDSGSAASTLSGGDAETPPSSLMDKIRDSLHASDLMRVSTMFSEILTEAEDLEDGSGSDSSDDEANDTDAKPFEGVACLDDVTVTRQIGAGNFGDVFLGNWQGQFVALKSIRVSRGVKGDEAREALAKELAVHTTLNSPRIVRMFGQAVFEGDVFLVMEYVSCGDLYTALRQRADDNPLPAVVLLRMCVHLAEGVNYLHKQQIVHRDLACRNLLTNSRWEVKLGDLGLARRLEGGEYFSSGPIPIRWSAPLLLVDKKVTMPGEIYSMAVTCWEILAMGQTPFADIELNVDVVRAVVGGLRPSRDALVSDCPDSVFDVLQAWWAADSAERPTAAEALNQIRDSFDAVAPQDGGGALSDENSQALVPPSNTGAYARTPITPSGSGAYDRTRVAGASLERSGDVVDHGGTYYHTPSHVGATTPPMELTNDSVDFRDRAQKRMAYATRISVFEGVTYTTEINVADDTDG